MPSININTSLKGTKGMELVGEWLDGTFDDMIKELPQLLNKSLNTAGYILKESVKHTFATKMPAASRAFKVPATSKGGYKITRPDKLVDAARQSKTDGQHVTVFMGGRDKGSPLFISRMYDKGTGDRYVKTNKGVKLKTKKFVGHLTGVDYWDPGIIAGEQEAYNAIERIITNKIETQFQ